MSKSNQRTAVLRLAEASCERSNSSHDTNKENAGNHVGRSVHAESSDDDTTSRCSTVVISNKRGIMADKVQQLEEGEGETAQANETDVAAAVRQFVHQVSRDFGNDAAVAMANNMRSWTTGSNNFRLAVAEEIRSSLPSTDESHWPNLITSMLEAVDTMVERGWWTNVSDSLMPDQPQPLDLEDNADGMSVSSTSHQSRGSARAADEFPIPHPSEVQRPESHEQQDSPSKGNESSLSSGSTTRRREIKKDKAATGSDEDDRKMASMTQRGQDATEDEGDAAAYWRFMDTRMEADIGRSSHGADALIGQQGNPDPYANANDNDDAVAAADEREAIGADNDGPASGGLVAQVASHDGDDDDDDEEGKEEQEEEEVEEDVAIAFDQRTAMQPIDVTSGSNVGSTRGDIVVIVEEEEEEEHEQEDIDDDDDEEGEGGGDDDNATNQGAASQLVGAGGGGGGASAGQGGTASNPQAGGCLPQCSCNVL